MVSKLKHQLQYLFDSLREILGSGYVPSCNLFLVNISRASTTTHFATPQASELETAVHKVVDINAVLGTPVIAADNHASIFLSALIRTHVP